MVLVLFETASGYALFKVLDKGLLEEADLAKHFTTPEGAAEKVKLQAFKKFEDTTQALAAAAAICEGTLDKGLKKFLKKNIVTPGLKDKLAVIDTKLGAAIKEGLSIKCLHDAAVAELHRGIRTNFESLLEGISSSDVKAMKLGLAHTLARYKLKMSPDKVDTMIIQAISLLDELDKELNTYAMRVREWYGWHFPEMGKIVTDNIMFAKTVKTMGFRTHAATIDLSAVLPEEVEAELKTAAEVSMGTEISEEDISNIQQLCEQVISIHEYRQSLYEYLKNRMNAIAPNLTVMVGELVGARLISHAGSLISLAKQPASTVQILGAEKALFRALKTKHDTPKYGLIYHASLVGQAPLKLKGKISRVVANKTALSTRIDALGETENVEVGMHWKEQVEFRLRQLETGNTKALSGTGKGKAKEEKYSKKAPAKTYNADADVTMGTEAPKKKRKAADDEEEAPVTKKIKKEAVAEDGEETEKEKKKKKKKEKQAAEADE